MMFIHWKKPDGGRAATSVNIAEWEGEVLQARREHLQVQAGETTLGAPMEPAALTAQERLDYVVALAAELQDAGAVPAGWVLIDVANAPPAPGTDELAAQASVRINAGAAKALSALSANYPDGEVQSWAQQTREAEALAADPQAPAPLLTAIAAARGLTVAELADRVRVKVAAYATASGAIIGQRQALEDAVNAVDLAAANAAERLEAIQWPA